MGSAIGRKIYFRTACNRVVQMRFRSYRPLLRLPLTLKHRLVRLNWCKEKSMQNQCIRVHDGRINVRQRVSERDQDTCILTRHTAPLLELRYGVLLHIILGQP